MAGTKGLKRLTADGRFVPRFIAEKPDLLDLPIKSSPTIREGLYQFPHSSSHRLHILWFGETGLFDIYYDREHGGADKAWAELDILSAQCVVDELWAGRVP